MIGYIKKSFLKRSLKKHKSFRDKKITSLDKAQSIGIIGQITNENSYKEIHTLFSALQTPRRSVWLMGFVDKNSVPYYCLQQLSADYFCKKNLNWYGKPSFIQLDDFLDKDFDILIDFSRNNLPSLHYILAMTKAKLLIGGNEHSQELYDIFIDDEEELAHHQFLSVIDNYLHKFTGHASHQSI
jgi:hypothetical protein